MGLGGIAAAVCALLAVGCLIAGIVTPFWFMAEVGGAKSVVGLHSVCAGGNPDWICRSNTYNSSSIFCAVARDAGSWKTRGLTILGLAAGGAALAVIGSVMAILGATVIPVVGLAAVLLSVTAFVASVGSLVLFLFTMERWLFCGSTYCEWLRTALGSTQSCSTQFGWSGIVFSVGVALLAVAVALSCTLLSNTPVDAAETTEGVESAAASRVMENDNAATTVDYTTTAAADGPQDEHHPGAVQGDDDWVADEASGYQWSESQQLYYDPESGHYYDPKTELWCDPETGDWYAA